MDENILKILKDLETEKGFKILFAIESGSRAWRMESTDSDYDVRFVYYWPLKEYLGISTPNEVTTVAYDKDLIRSKPEGCLLDLQGFDIYKYARLLMKSNPTAIEWATSDIVYRGKAPKEFTDFVKKRANPIALYYHYRSMGESTYLKYIKSNVFVTYKKYLYALRGILSALYVLKHEKSCPISFKETVRILRKEKDISQEIYELIRDLIEKKSKGLEKGKIDRITKLDKYIEKRLEDKKEPKSLKIFDKTIERYVVKLVQLSK